LTGAQLLLLLAFAALHCLLIWSGISHLQRVVWFTTPAQLALYVVGWATKCDRPKRCVWGGV
jgi:uncharacterized membrane protein YjdF